MLVSLVYVESSLLYVDSSPDVPYIELTYPTTADVALPKG